MTAQDVAKEAYNYNFCLKSDGIRQAKIKGRSVFFVRICPFLRFLDLCPGRIGAFPYPAPNRSARARAAYSPARRASASVLAWPPISISKLPVERSWL